MTITIDLNPEQEARLHEKAARRGKGVGSYLVEVALQEAEPDEWLQQLYGLGRETGVSLTDEDVSRQRLYADY